jgi:hypothetical protein
MQSSEYLTAPADIALARSHWLALRDVAVTVSATLADPNGLDIHKQIANRLIEPWSWITVAVTGDNDAWSNYFALRCHPDAQREIQIQAYLAQKRYFTNVPRVLTAGEWHTPYFDDSEWPDVVDWLNLKNGGADPEICAAPSPAQIEDAIIKISTGRCARTSYLTQEGKRDFQEDVNLHDRLRNHTPMHASPFEHVCVATGDERRYGKYTGFEAYRHMLPREYVKDFQPNWQDFDYTGFE